MTNDDEPPGRTEPAKWLIAAAGVHAFTALGAVCALLAVHAVLESAFELAFVWLGVAFVIDGIDGTFARAVDVHRRLPRISGERLDLVVDYVTYVFVPVLAMQEGGFLTGGWGLVLAAAALLSSLFHFSDTDSKSEDHCFVGFPAVWNIVAFYFFAFATPGWLARAIVVACVILTFIPMRWVHPMRVVALRTLNIAATVAWSLAAIAAVWGGFPAGPWPRLVLAIVAVYGVALAVLWPWLRAREIRGGG